MLANGGKKADPSVFQEAAVRFPGLTPSSPQEGELFGPGQQSQGENI